mmetsp:Transcript_20748/g.64060  ORF Transcript_20748/g.64060 Transcript_20748/m.64060 type:complete len:364 (+) Transcript_20748:83-1174(+)
MGCTVSTTEDGRLIVKSKYFPEYRKGLPKMDGKVVAITGSTSGTGKILAKVCAELGAKVVMLNRASDRADAALDDIKKAANDSKAPEPLLIPCDLTSFKSVRAAGDKMNSELAKEGLDALVNNAAIMGFGDEATEDGCDIQMETNHTSHFLLTYLCMPLLETAASLRGEARIVNHSSAARKMDAPMVNKFDAKYVDKNGGNLGGTSHKMFKGGNFQRYQQTKLANVVFTYALDEKLKAKGSKVKALVAHPGVAPTQLATHTMENGGMDDVKNMPKCVSNLIFSMMMQSEEDATLGIMRCTCDPEVESRQFYGPKGKKEDSDTHDQSEYSGMAELKAEEKLADKEAQLALWAASEKACGITFDL